MLNVGNVYAVTFTINPNAVTQGQSFQVSATGLPPSQSFTVSVFADTSGRCVLPPLFVQAGKVSAGGNVGPVTFSSASLGIGTHCVTIDIPGVFLDTGSVAVTPAAVPEYSYGLAPIAAFMVLGYAVVKRRTRA